LLLNQLRNFKKYLLNIFRQIKQENIYMIYYNVGLTAKRGKKNVTNNIIMYNLKGMNVQSKLKRYIFCPTIATARRPFHIEK